MPKVRIHERVKQYLVDIPIKHAKQIVSKIDAYRQDEKNILLEKLSGYQKYYRIRSGEYRIVLFRDKDDSLVVLIAKRNDDEVYKELRKIVK